ncbi:hypothetical protein ASD01_21720 [Ensifer sp. Root423]|nr:hypothetical protein ASD01_21720 [Ensifer sp. Root423]
MCIAKRPTRPHLYFIEEKTKASKKMTTTTYHKGFIGRAFAVLGAASAAAAAVEGHRRPKASDLHTLGIDPANFPDTRRG